MQLGMYLPTNWPGAEPQAARRAVEAAARAAEDLGYTSIWAKDHLVVPAQYPEWSHVLEPLITLASLIHLVPRVQLGTAVLVLPQRHAVLVAKQVAALDVLSQERFIFGIGAGWMGEEFRLLQADFERRGAVMDEAIDAMRTLWQASPASFQGQVYAFADALCHPQPARGGPPLWVGGNTPAAVRRAARVGAAWFPFRMGAAHLAAGVAEFAAGMALLEQLCEGRPRVRGSLSVTMRLPSATDTLITVLQQYRQAGLDALVWEFDAESGDDLLEQMQRLVDQVAPQLAG